MSDDFNQLRPPDDNDERFDWQPDESDSEEKPSKPGDHLGFTGELSWRQDVEKAFSERLDEANEESLDWQDDPSQQPSESDQPDMFADWQGNQPDENAPQNTGDDDVPDWLSAFTSDQPTESESEPPVDMPPWMAQMPAGDEPEETQPAPAEDVPSWLREQAAQTEEQPAAQQEEFSPADELPPWLQNPEPPGEEPAESIPGGDVPPWLAGLEEPAQQPALTDEDLLAGLDEALGIMPEQPSEPQAQGLDAFLVEEVVDDTFFSESPAGEPEAEAAEETIPLPEWLTSGKIIDFGAVKLPASPPAEETPEAAEEFPDWLGAAAPAPAGEAEEQPAGDLFAGWMAEPPAASEAEEVPVESEEVPDWLAAAAPPAGQPQAAAPKDIFDELGLPAPETGFDFLDNPPAEPAAVETPDWFAEEQPAGAAPGWLDELGEVQQPAEDDLLAELRAASGSPEQPRRQEPAIEQPTFQDLDSLLASYETPAAQAEDHALVDTGTEDIDRLFSGEDLEQIAARRAPPPEPSELTPETPEWLTESGVLVDETSAAAILRKRSDRERPLDELDERLQALHEHGMELSAPAEVPPPGDLKSLLPGVTQFIPAAPIKTGATGIAGELTLTPQQTEKIQLLRSLIAVEEDGSKVQPPSALDLTYEAPSLADIAGEEGEAQQQPEEEPAPAPYPLPRRRPKLGRLLIALLVAVGVILPFFVGPLRVGNLPPAQFAAGSRQQAVFDRMDDLAPGNLVLIAAEYGPTGAGELDSLTESLLRHALLKGARPVIVSANPLGLLHAQNIMSRITGDAAFMAQVNRPLVANRDYYVVRYLAGSVTGLRAFSQNVMSALSTDITGAATHLVPSSLRDFALITVIAERAEDLRMWAEQVAPLAGKPLAAAVGMSAAPLSEPYVLLNAPENLSGLNGLLIGYADAYTYRDQLEAVAPVEPASIPTLPPTPIPPTVVPPIAVPPSDLTAAPSGEESAQTPIPAEPGAAGETTPEEAAATTVEPGAESSAPVITGVINSSQSVNVREGPGTTFARVAIGRPGQRVQIIGRNGAGDWLQIRLNDGTEGWIAASLLNIEEPATPAPGSSSRPDPNAVVSLISDVSRAAFQPETTPEATAETSVGVESPVFVPEAAADVQDVVTASPAPYRDERWYGMTLGLIVIIGVITVGTVINVLGGLSRRRRR